MTEFGSYKHLQNILERKFQFGPLLLKQRQTERMKILSFKSILQLFTPDFFITGLHLRPLRVNYLMMMSGPGRYGRRIHMSLLPCFRMTREIFGESL